MAKTVQILQRKESLKDILAKKAEPPLLLNFKITKAEKEALQKLADQYAGGNLSLWLRYAAMNYRP